MKRFTVSLLLVATAAAANAQVTRVDRPYQAASTASPAPVALPVKPRASSPLEGKTIRSLPAATMGRAAAPISSSTTNPETGAPQTQPRQAVAALPAPPAGPSTGAAIQSSAFEFRVTAEDIVVRRALTRWAGAAGWTFNDALWAVSRDYPILASANFGSDFKEAVRALLGATKLSDGGPVKPCFYSNSVLRVVPVTERCDRSTD